MPAIFADSGYWIALWNPRDALHQRAMTLADRLGMVDIVTTQMVLTEALDAMAGMGEFRRRFAAQMVQALEDNHNVEIVPQMDSQFRTALERYSSRSDQRWGLTDCASFPVMEERGLIEALAYDRDFEQAGSIK